MIELLRRCWGLRRYMYGSYCCGGLTPHVLLLLLHRVTPPQGPQSYCCCNFGGLTPHELLLLLRGVNPPRGSRRLLLRGLD